METTPQTVNCKTATIKQLKDAYYSKTPIEGLEFIGTHYGAHNDEIHGGYLLIKTPQGMYLFPGIEKASFGSLSTTYLRKNGLLGKDGFFKAMQMGILLLGVGGGLLDEHGDRHKRISCTELVVRLLDLRKEKDDRKVYGRLIDYVNYEDQNGDNALLCLNRLRKESDPKFTEDESGLLLKLQIGALAQNLKKGFEFAGEDTAKQKEVFDMAFKFYDNEINQAKLFLKAEEAYAIASKKVMPLAIPSKKHPFVLLEMQCDATGINKVVHSKWRDNRTEKLGVLFLHNSKGQFVLMPNQLHINTNDMKEIVKILRQTIARKTNAPTPLHFDELGKGGVIEGIYEIHFDEPTGVISNGSKVDPDVDGLIGNLLSVEEIIEAIQIGLDTEYFPKEFARACQNGKCAERKCPLYHFGLQRCIDARQTNPQFAEVKKALVVN